MDMRLFYLQLMSGFLTFHKCNGIQWATGLEDNAVVYACAGGSVSLPWAVIVSPGEVIENIQWTFSGRSDELIATEVHGQFIAFPAFSGRVNKSNNAGINISGMHVLDTGNYSVEVIVRKPSGNIETLWRKVFVRVADHLQTVDGQLHVTQYSVAEYNNQTDEYELVLSCGNFTYPTQPPFQATWVTPSGKNVNSDKYENNQFFVMLSNPVEIGSYICRVSDSAACLHGNSPAIGGATISKMDAREAIFEARLLSLESRNALLNSELKAKDSEISALKVKDAELGEEITTLKAKTDKFQRAVAFHAILSIDRVNCTVNDALRFDNVVTNFGNGYNPITGRFTAPGNGTYFFIASGEETSNVEFMYIALMAGAQLHSVSTKGNLDYQSGTVHGVVYLTAGETAWVKILNTENIFLGGYTAFSGFLVHPETQPVP